VQKNLQIREQEARQAEALVEEYAFEFSRWMESRGAAGTTRSLRGLARTQRAEVMEKARRMLAAGKPPEQVAEFVAVTLSHKLLHLPSAALRKADAVEQALLLASTRKLFQLPEEDGD